MMGHLLVQDFLNSLDQNGPAFGIHLNFNKCEVFRPSGNQQFTQFDHDIRRINVNSSGSELLGSPIVGINHFFDNFFQTRVSKVLDAQSHLSELNDPQVELHLLRSCLSLCKLNHLLRTTPPNKVMHQLHRYDEGLRHSLQTILGCSVSDLSWKQATLPIRLGGFGLGEASRTAPAAFLSSCHSTQCLAMHFIGKNVVSIRDSNSVPGEDSAAAIMTHLLGHPLSFTDSSQHGLQNGLDLSLLSTVKAGSSLRDQARLSTLSAPHSGLWLRAFPNPKVGLSMIREELQRHLKSG